MSAAMGSRCADGCPTLLNMLVIVVGGIPIAMPTVLSVTLALGASALAKEGAIVARMSAVEEMAGTNILCSDKTGAARVRGSQLPVFSPAGPARALLGWRPVLPVQCSIPLQRRAVRMQGTCGSVWT